MKFTNFKNAVAFVAIAFLFQSVMTSSVRADGNVSVRFTGQNQLTVTGDAKNNDVTIYQDGKYLRVVGRNGTTLNSSRLVRQLSFPLFSRAQSAKELVVDLGAGDDTLEICDTNDVTKIEASTGTGNDVGEFNNLNVQGDVALACEGKGVLDLGDVDSRWLICYANKCELTSTDCQYIWVMSNDAELLSPSAAGLLVQSLPAASYTSILIDSAEVTDMEIFTDQSTSKDNIEITRCDVARDMTIKTGDLYDYLVVDRTEGRDLDIDLGDSTNYDIALITGGDYRDVSIVNDFSITYISVSDVVADHLDLDVEGDRSWTYLNRTELTGEVNVKLGSGNDSLSTLSLISPYAYFDGGLGRDVLNQRTNQLGDSEIVNFEVFTR